MTENLSYEEALDRINHILKELEAGNIGMSDLQAKVKEAYDLLTFCQDRLRDIDTSIKNMAPRDMPSDK